MNLSKSLTRILEKIYNLLMGKGPVSKLKINGIIQKYKSADIKAHSIALTNTYYF